MVWSVCVAVASFLSTTANAQSEEGDADVPSAGVSSPPPTPPETEDVSASDSNPNPPFGVAYSVPLIAQPSDTTCWAAAAAMLAAAGGVPDAGPTNLVTGHGWSDGIPLQTSGTFRTLMADVKKYTASEIFDLLTAKGPLLVVYNIGSPLYELAGAGPPPYHLVVITSIAGTGTHFEAATLTYNDPWKGGSVKTTTVGDMLAHMNESNRRLGTSGHYVGFLTVRPEPKP